MCLCANQQETGEQGLVETLLQRIHQVANKVTKQRSACPERPQQQDLISHEEEEEDFHVGVLRQSKKLKVLPGQSKPIPHGPSILHTLLDAAETALELLPIESMFSQAASPYKDRDGKPWNNGVNSFAPTVRREGVPPGVTGVKYGIWGMMNAAFKPGDAQERCENCRLMGIRFLPTADT